VCVDGWHPYPVAHDFALAALGKPESHFEISPRRRRATWPPHSPRLAASGHDASRIIPPSTYLLQRDHRRHFPLVWPFRTRNDPTTHPTHAIPSHPYRYTCTLIRSRAASMYCSCSLPPTVDQTANDGDAYAALGISDSQFQPRRWMGGARQIPSAKVAEVGPSIQDRDESRATRNCRRTGGNKGASFLTATTTTAAATHTSLQNARSTELAK